MEGTKDSPQKTGPTASLPAGDRCVPMKMPRRLTDEEKLLPPTWGGFQSDSTSGVETFSYLRFGFGLDSQPFQSPSDNPPPAVVPHAEKRPPIMCKKVTFGEIYRKRFNEILDNVDQKSANAGTARSVFGIIPYVVTLSFFEYLWKRIVRKKNRNI